MRTLLLALTIATAGCGAQWDVVSPDGEKESFLLAETARFAGLMGVKVRGEITDTPYYVGTSVATGWYTSGTAYYYRPLVKNLEFQPTAGRETLTNVAAHEVCHTVSINHDLAHWECMNRWAFPTYPKPV